MSKLLSILIAAVFAVSTASVIAASDKKDAPAAKETKDAKADAKASDKTAPKADGKKDAKKDSKKDVKEPAAK